MVPGTRSMQPFTHQLHGSIAECIPAASAKRRIDEDNNPRPRVSFRTWGSRQTRQPSASSTCAETANDRHENGEQEHFDEYAEDAQREDWVPDPAWPGQGRQERVSPSQRPWDPDEQRPWDPDEEPGRQLQAYNVPGRIRLGSRMSQNADARHQKQMLDWFRKPEGWTQTFAWTPLESWTDENELFNEITFFQDAYPPPDAIMKICTLMCNEGEVSGQWRLCGERFLLVNLEGQATWILQQIPSTCTWIGFTFPNRPQSPTVLMSFQL